MFKLFDGRDYLYQWDLDRKIIVSDPTIEEVHFCNGTGDCSLVVEVYEEGGLRLANIPNIILQSSLPIRAYAYCGEQYTKVCETFKVNKRSKPSDYVYTETEVKDIEEILEKVEAAVDGKLDKVTTTSDAMRVYTVSADGTEQGVLEISHSTSNNKSMICAKAAGGIVKVGNPKAEKDAVPLGFADGRYVSKATSPFILPRAHCVQANGLGEELITVNQQASDGSIPRRGVGGVVEVGTPTAEHHATTKKYVDDALAQKRAIVTNANEMLTPDGIRTDCFYKGTEEPMAIILNEGFNTFNGTPIEWEVVDELPEEGESVYFVENDKSRWLFYYCKADKGIYGYYPIFKDNTDGSIDHWEWRTLATIAQEMYDGAIVKEIASLDEATEENVLYVLHLDGLSYYDGSTHRLVEKEELDGKLDILPPPTNGAWGVYTCKDDGTTTLLKATANTGGSIPMRGANGVVTVGTPTEDGHAVTLGYANEHYVQVQGGTGGNRVYGINPSGVQTIFAAATTNYAWSMPLRDDNFTFQVGEPTQDAHPATKKYVDDAVANAGGGAGGGGWKSGYVPGSQEYIVNAYTDFYSYEEGFIPPEAEALNVYIPMLGRDYVDFLMTMRDKNTKKFYGSGYVEIEDNGIDLVGYVTGTRFDIPGCENCSGDILIEVIASR